MNIADIATMVTTIHMAIETTTTATTMVSAGEVVGPWTMSKIPRCRPDPKMSPRTKLPKKLSLNTPDGDTVVDTTTHPITIALIPITVATHITITKVRTAYNIGLLMDFITHIFL